jgi:lysozyme family protein
VNDFDQITAVISAEGGDKYTNDPADPGGATKFGITIPALTDCWRDLGIQNAVPTVTDIQALTMDGARKFYAWFMDHTKIARIQNDTVRYFVFDAAVHMGAMQAVKLLQRALGVTDDGVLGPVTLAACPIVDGNKLARLVGVEQMLFYGRLAAGNLTDADKDGKPDQLEFLPGYLNRLARKMRTVA